MSNKVLLEVEVTAKGIKVVQKDMDKVASSTNKASAATEKLSKSRNAYNKGEKGVASAGANSTKNFSKMRSVIGGGSSGLVGAYATLAANLFAATAAFNALRSASKVEELARGLDLVGIAAGRNLGLVAEGLQEITNRAISTEQALRTAAIATSANFSDDQLKRLTKVAKGASLALGRDLGDSLDRLVRGTAKLEPEILDELGIFVRLDDAVAKYAITLEKTSQELTDFERRQAFLNDAIAKGEERFSALAEELDTNPYDKLGASFANLTKNIVTALNTGITPAISFLSNNLSALAGSLLVVGSGVARQVAGTFVSTAASASEAASALQEQNKELRTNLETTDKLPAKYLSVNEKIKSGTANIQDYKTGLASLDDSVATHTRQLSKWEMEGKKTTEQLNEKRQKLSNVKDTYSNLRRELVVTTAAQANFTKAQALGAIQNFQFVTGIKLGIEAIKTYASGTYGAAKGAGVLAVANSVLKISFFGLGVVIGGVFTALLALLPIIGLVIAFGPQLYDWAKNKFFPESVIKENTDNLIANLDIIDKAVEKQTKNQAKALADAAGTANSVSGLLTEISNNVAAAAEIDAAASKKRQEEIEKETQAIERLLEIEKERAATRMYDPNSGQRAEEIAEREKRVKALRDEEEDANVAKQAQIRSISVAIKKLQDNLNDPSKQEIIPQSVIDKLVEQKNGLKDGSIALEDFQTNVENIQKPFNTLKTSIEAVNTKSSEFNKELNKISAKTSTPYDALINKSIELQNELQAVTDSAAVLNGVVTDNAAIDQANKNLSNAGFTNKDELDAYIVSMEGLRKKYLEFPGIIKKQEVALARIRKIGREDSNLLKEQLRQEVELLNTKKAQLDNEENFIRTAIQNGNASDAQVARLVTLGNERLKIEESLLQTRTHDAEIAVAQVKDQQKILKLTSGIQKANIAITKEKLKGQDLDRQVYLAKQKRDSFTAKEELAFFLTQKKAREDLIMQEFDAKSKVARAELLRQRIDIELLKARARLTGTELSNAETLDSLYQQQFERQNQLNAEQGINAFKALELEEEILRKKAKAEKTRSKTAGITGSDPMADREERIKQYEDILADATIAIDKIKKEFEDMGTELTSILQLSFEQLAPFIQALTDVLTVAFQPFFDMLDNLGPEGAATKKMVQGMLTMSQSMIDFAEADDLTGKLSAIGGLLGAIGTIAQASSDDRVAGIDKEIEAEKKRDGSSKASLQKIAALEAKKDAEKKKAFETNKKISLAQAAISTLVASLEVYKALAGIPFVGPALAAAASAAVIAVGAKTMSMIASQSYSGGSSTGSPASTPTITVGKQTTKTDLATSRGGAGELGYFRGESGTGGPENFQPPGAFMGAKYRAAGGPTTGYVVGEQGPELFVPQMPGRIIPEGESIQQAPVSATININAIDSTGVEDMLLDQRGNIIGMLREAVNSYGGSFYEEIDTSIYTPSAAGATRY